MGPDSSDSDSDGYKYDDCDYDCAWTDVDEDHRPAEPRPRTRQRVVREFGDFEENYGWVRCRSRTYPGQIYFHNTYSGCNTWCRPVSRRVHVPLVTVNANGNGNVSPS